MKTYVINGERSIKLEQVEFGEELVWVGDAYDVDGENLTNTDWNWPTEKEAFESIKMLLNYGKRYYTP